MSFEMLSAEQRRRRGLSEAAAERARQLHRCQPEGFEGFPPSRLKKDCRPASTAQTPANLTHLS